MTSFIKSHLVLTSSNKQWKNLQIPFEIWILHWHHRLPIHRTLATGCYANHSRPIQRKRKRNLGEGQERWLSESRILLPSLVPRVPQILQDSHDEGELTSLGCPLISTSMMWHGQAHTLKLNPKNLIKGNRIWKGQAEAVFK